MRCGGGGVEGDAAGVAAAHIAARKGVVGCGGVVGISIDVGIAAEGWCNGVVGGVEMRWDMAVRGKEKCHGFVFFPPFFFSCLPRTTKTTPFMPPFILYS
jgi:hypothetical protein